jgi:hypothetical protein
MERIGERRKEKEREEEKRRRRKKGRRRRRESEVGKDSILDFVKAIVRELRECKKKDVGRERVREGEKDIDFSNFLICPT